MHHIQVPKSPISCNKFFPCKFHGVFQHHRKKPSCATATFQPFSVSCTKNGKGVGISVEGTPKPTNFAGREEEGTERGGAKVVDIATLGNLCVDVVLNVPALPPPSVEERKAYMEQLSDSCPDKKYWEAGGNCNLAIAAARLGLHCITLGHVGNEIYGHFLLDVLGKEGIAMVEMNEDSEVADSSSYETLLCYVLVDPSQRHGFCSRADFSKDPAFRWMNKLSAEVQMAIKQSKILFCNGYVFDELTPGIIISTMEYAIDVGTAIFFDPGPRGKSLLQGTTEQQKAIQLFLKMSDVILLTADEAESLTRIGNPILAGQDLIRKGVRTKWVIIKMGSRGSILITTSTVCGVPAFKVDVVDTVGCGDSFTAAVAFGFLHDSPPINTLALANAVGAATAMGCGAGRNVASLSKVMELLRVSNLSDNDELWNKFIDGNLDMAEIILLSKTVVNGCSNQLTLVPMQKVISELLPQLEAMLARRVEQL